MVTNTSTGNGQNEHEMQTEGIAVNTVAPVTSSLPNTTSKRRKNSSPSADEIDHGLVPSIVESALFSVQKNIGPVDVFIFADGRIGIVLPKQIEQCRKCLHFRLNAEMNVETGLCLATCSTPAETPGTE